MKTRLLVIGLAATATLVGCATSQPQYGSYRGDRGYDRGYAQPAPRCVDCGTVTRIDEVGPTRTAPTGTGAVLGGIVGAVAGRQISKETGGSKGNKNVSAVAGAAAGALAGNAIQNNVTSSSFDVQVRMDDGRVIVVNQRDLDGVRENAYVRVVNGRVVLR
ncbi:MULTISPECIES: glycine zipper 2TM domain-containing protein [Xanthomonas]|uniref:Glycine zipper 2TM domain-containing protein n=1 Tax=Xanthomonas cucurbitae TaxID=56453 RepID=A0A2S7DRB6_9XANT|nr:glycine zipper 2TM domain-containing protein [Xanthomonas cucurbitae]PPU76320.1 peptidoglycan-associated outer membrane lipoprotein precursor [Xanthomonas cucurbitae]QHG86643.1 glycine zipper 2TM domain-containing protein [Xanthomonas cucurbitae]WDM68948.1 glycine zipper 2TM domain-containing protein [Xanthomonas cucurbitae]WDM72820.1 glycine zipper 2TM domain-containing protein [Xanthomonas cucurbitae]WDM76558.1 glycine zipper 2TM domain-containing protein [Xanthomonas cucurbitae]